MMQTIARHLKLIIVWGVIFALVTGAVSWFFPRQYSAESQVLIISRDRTGVDPYTQAKAAGSIGENLANIIQTTDFYNKVMSSPSSDFDKTVWQNLSARDQRKQWEKNVRASMVYNTSIMSITAFANTQDEAVKFSRALANVVASQGWEYVGGDVAIKIVSDPLASRLPARPNFILNTVLGFFLGALIATLWASKYRRSVLFGN